MSFLLTLWQWRSWFGYAAVAVVVAGVVLWFSHVLSDRRELQAANHSLKLTIAELEKRNASKDRALRSLEQEIADAQARAKAVTKQREEVLRAPSSADGPVAPVLRGALDGLRQ